MLTVQTQKLLFVHGVHYISNSICFRNAYVKDAVPLEIAGAVFWCLWSPSNVVLTQLFKKHLGWYARLISLKIEKFEIWKYTSTPTWSKGVPKKRSIRGYCTRIVSYHRGSYWWSPCCKAEAHTAPIPCSHPHNYYHCFLFCVSNTLQWQ